MVKYKCGAILKEVPKGAEKWYIKAGWKKIETSKKEEKKEINDKTDPEKTATT